MQSPPEIIYFKNTPAPPPPPPGNLMVAPLVVQIDTALHG